MTGQLSPTIEQARAAEMLLVIATMEEFSVELCPERPSHAELRDARAELERIVAQPGMIIRPRL